jgi:hypothetical protein
VTLLAFLLLLMLSVTTPTGTGDGAHSAVLLHPLFTHTHLIDGRIVFHQPTETAPGASTSPQDGPAVGAEAGAAAAAGVAISPNVPHQDLHLQITNVMRWPTFESMPPRGLILPPPDPPPTFGG